MPVDESIENTPWGFQLPDIADVQLRERVQRILATAETLDEIGHLLGGKVSERRLRQFGLWSLRVECVTSGPINHYSTDRVNAGEQGTIGWSYPVSASLFAFELEAPVLGLQCMPNGTAGVPWSMLKAVSERGR